MAENIAKIYNLHGIDDGFGNGITQDYCSFVWLATPNGGKQRIDIFVFGWKIAIEYDGQGHFYPVKFGGMSDEKAENVFQKTKARDPVKNAKIAAHKEDVQYFIRFSYLDDIYDINAVRQKLIDNGIPVPPMENQND